MGARGPKPKPQEILDLRGTTQKCRARRIINGVMITDASVLLTNKGMRVLETERMKEIFVDTCNVLISLKLLEYAYVPMIIMYSYYLGRWENLSMEIAVEGTMIECTHMDKKGEPFTLIIENPKIKIQKNCGEAAAKLADLFGMTPVSRQRMPNGTIEEAPAQKLMKALSKGL